MKAKQLLIIMLGVAFSMTAAAQGGPRGGHMSNKTPEEKAQRQTEWMTKELGLSEKQAKEVGEINLKHKKEVAAIRAETKAKLNASRDAKEAELKGTLSTEQYEKLTQIRADRKAKRGERASQHKAECKGDGRGDGRGQMMQHHQE